ncbi:MAG: Hsp20 family protein [Candidatus Poseidoniales archaeon]|jgi:molecular chaperone IbpA
MNNLLRWEKYAPVSLGLEETFARLDALASNGTNYPPYDIVKISEEEQHLVLALAGYSKEDLEVSVENKVLTIRSISDTTDDSVQYLHRGIAKRNFTRSWELGKYAEVGTPQFLNGLLSVPVKVEVPEAQKRRLLPVS